MAVRDLPVTIMFASVLVGLASTPATAATKKTASTARSAAPRVTIQSLDSAPVRRAPRGTHLAQAPGMGRRDAFSPAPMQSKAKLLQCLRGDARYRKNLARHFGVSETSLVSYVDENVQVFTLKEDMKTDVYAVTRSGRQYRVAQRLPKGMLVFGLPGGYVMMKSNCGNPVIASLPPVPSPAPLAVAPLPPPPSVPVAPETEVAGVREEVPPVAVVSPPVEPPVTAPLPVIPEGQELAALTPVIVGEPAVGQVDAFPGVRSAARRRGGGFPWWLGGLGGLAFIGGGDDDDNGGPPVIPPPIVPEPSSALLVVTGGAVLLICSRKRK